MAVSIELIKNILLDSSERVQEIEYLPRQLEIESRMPYVFIGVRRCGKSFLLYQRMHELAAAGHGWNEFLYLNFEDERLLGFDVTDFQLLLEAHWSLRQSEPIFFLDEIQNIDGWEHFARRIADEKRLAYLTGSNAKMLSREIASNLGGRYLSKMVYPYSFYEFLSSHDIRVNEKLLNSTRGRAELSRHFDEYFRFGGFPELSRLTLKRDYLSSIYRKIFLGDIIMRYELSNTKALEVLMKKLAETVRQDISYTRLANIVKSSGIPFGTSTCIQYLEHAKESQLIFSIENIASALVERRTSPKYYFIDNGLLNLFLMDADAALLENMAAIDLVRRYGRENRVFFYKEKIEVDFYIPEDSLAIQVCYSLEKPETYKREVSALLKIAQRFDCSRLVILSYSEERVLEENGRKIEVIPLWKWLLTEPESAESVLGT